MSPEAYVRMAQLEDKHWWFVARREILRHILQALPLPPTPEILELGCGTGGNLSMLQGFGAVTAVEMNDYARLHAGKRHNCRVLPGYLPNHLPPLPPADLICLFDVLEHISDDYGALRTILNYIRPDGYLVLTVPAYQWLWSTHDIAHHHQRRYNIGYLSKMAAQVGWEIQRIGYFNTWLLPIAIAHRVKQRLFPRPCKECSSSLPPSWVNSLFRRIFTTEAYWLRENTFPCGLSIFAVLKPKK